MPGGFHESRTPGAWRTGLDCPFATVSACNLLPAFHLLKWRGVRVSIPRVQPKANCPPARPSAESRQPVYARRDCRAVCRPWIALLPIVVSAWMAYPNLLSGAEGAVGAVERSVPVYFFLPQDEPGESAYFGPPEPLLTQVPGDECVQGCSRADRVDALGVLSAATTDAARAPFNSIDVFEVAMAQRDRGSFFRSPPNCQFDPTFWPLRQAFFDQQDPTVRQQPAPTCRVPDVDEFQDRGNRLIVSSIGRRPMAPSGTMFLWSFDSVMAGGHDSQLPAGRSGPSAGFVLTRPPGDYSLDWVGVAVAAPIH